MSFSFSPELPGALDRVRLALGDTVAPGLRADETINAMVTANGEAEAVARLAEGLAAEYGQQPDSLSADGSSISWRDRVKTWLEVAARMRVVGATAAIAATASIAATRGEETYAEYQRPTSWVWND